MLYVVIKCKRRIESFGTQYESLIKHGSNNQQEGVSQQKHAIYNLLLSIAFQGQSAKNKKIREVLPRNHYFQEDYPFNPFKKQSSIDGNISFES